MPTSVAGRRVRPIAITGATGLLGTWLRRTAPPAVDVVALTHRTRLDDGAEIVADLRCADDTTDAIAVADPSVVIHAAYAKSAEAIVDAARNVADAAARVQADLVFVSTEAVFCGDGRARPEDAVPDPVSDYGRWKAAAEQIVATISPRSAIVRLPLIVSFDPDDPTVAQIRRDAAQGRVSTWYDDEFRPPALAADLAGAIWQITLLDPAARAGVWHLPGPERLSRHEIAKRVASALGLDPGAVGRGSGPPATERPRDLALADDRARREIGWAPSPIPA